MTKFRVIDTPDFLVYKMLSCNIVMIREILQNIYNGKYFSFYSRYTYICYLPYE